MNRSLFLDSRRITKLNRRVTVSKIFKESYLIMSRNILLYSLSLISKSYILEIVFIHDMMEIKYCVD